MGCANVVIAVPFTSSLFQKSARDLHEKQAAREEMLRRTVERRFQAQRGSRHGLGGVRVMLDEMLNAPDPRSKDGKRLRGSIREDMLPVVPVKQEDWRRNSSDGSYVDGNEED